MRCSRLGSRFVGTLLAAAAVVVVLAPVARAAEEQAFDRQAWNARIVELGLDPETVIYPFSVTPEMERWADDAVSGPGVRSPVQRLVRIQEAIFEGDEFDFAYDRAQTLTAPEAFAARSGNCLAFTALFIALTRSVGVPTKLMSVARTPRVERDDGLVVINRHVVAVYRSGRGTVTFDFNFSSDEEVVHRSVIDDVEASAMFHNNLGAAALRDGDVDAAVRHFELATTLWPEWSVGWVNRGVAFARSGHVDDALDCYRRALERDPGNPSALNNLAHVYLGLGLEDEALNARRAAARDTDSPFTLIALAEAEAIRGRLKQAERHLKRARRWHAAEPEVWYASARLADRVGKDRRAARYRAKAKKLAARRPHS